MNSDNIVKKMARKGGKFVFYIPADIDFRNVNYPHFEMTLPHHAG